MYMNMNSMTRQDLLVLLSDGWEPTTVEKLYDEDGLEFGEKTEDGWRLEKCGTDDTVYVRRTHVGTDGSVLCVRLYACTYSVAGECPDHWREYEVQINEERTSSSQ